MLAFHSDAHSLALPPGHRFPQSKYRMLRERLERAPGLLRLRPAPAALEEELLLAHTPAHVEAVLQGRLSAAQQREIGFPWSPALAERSRHSVGATIAAARAALAEGVAANLAGGTHHAHADRGSGFCLFNDVAVAARLMQAEWRGGPAAVAAGAAGAGLLRVLVIDLDVHQGDGTAAIFRDDPTVFTCSMHGERNFPARKHPSDLDVGLPDGCGDEDYLAALDQTLARIGQAHGVAAPGLAFYLAGADPHEGDRLGRLRLSEAGLRERDRRVLAWLLERRIPAVIAMAGGYGHDLALTVDLQVNTLSEAAHAWSDWRAHGWNNREHERDE